MGSPYVGEIRLFAGNFAINGWAFCDGSLLPISQYETLFTLIGTTYGGDGQSTFALPDLRGRVPVHVGNGFVLGETFGAETVALNASQIPSHVHPFNVTTAAATSLSPTNNYLATGARPLYTADTTASRIVPLAGNAIGPAGGSQPHPNLMPTLTINFIISLFGIFPSAT